MWFTSTIFCSLCLTICLSWISVYCWICLGSFSPGESYDLKIINIYKQCRNKLRGLAYYLGLHAMLTWLLGLSGLELSHICLLWRADGDNRQLSVSVRAVMLWAWQHPWQHPWHHFGSWRTRLNGSSLPKLESTPCWSTNSVGCNRQLPFSDQILKLCFWFDRCKSCSLFVGHTWHWAEHSSLSSLQNWTEDGLNYISTLIRRLHIWCPLSGHHPNSPVDGNKHEVTITAFTSPYPVLVASRSKTSLW